MLTRKDFIGSLSAACAVTAFGGGEGDPLCVGVLSDIHVSDEKDLDIVRTAFKYYRDRRVDGVLIAGDMANTGRVDQLELVARAWREIFPDDRGSDGRKVEKLFIYGNHDVARWEKCKQTGKMIWTDRATAWEQAFGELYRPIWIKWIKGRAFIGAHWGEERGLAEFLAAQGDALKGPKPFFYTQHAHPGNTVNGPWAWGNDGGRATAVLSKYPNAVAFSGHSHYSLTDERTIWQGAFTSVGTSSLKYIFAQYGRENGEKHGTRPLQMPNLPEGAGKQGLLMTVDSSGIRLARRDFLNGESLGPDWVIPPDGSRPFAFDVRRAQATAPRFAADAQVSVKAIRGKDRDGRERDQVLVSFPAAEPSGASRVYDYEVRALTWFEDVDSVAATRRVLAEDFFLSRTRKAASGSCVFALSDLPKDAEVTFAVRPCECFGRKGEAILSTPFNTKVVDR